MKQKIVIGSLMAALTGIATTSIVRADECGDAASWLPPSGNYTYIINAQGLASEAKFLVSAAGIWSAVKNDKDTLEHNDPGKGTLLRISQIANPTYRPYSPSTAGNDPGKPYPQADYARSRLKYKVVFGTSKDGGSVHELDYNSAICGSDGKVTSINGTVYRVGSMATAEDMSPIGSGTIKRAP
jgi:hypothetical protein